MDDLKSSRSIRETPGPDFELLDARIPSRTPANVSKPHLSEPQRSSAKLCEPQRMFCEPSRTPADVSKPHRNFANLSEPQISEPQRTFANLREPLRTLVPLSFPQRTLANFRERLANPKRTLRKPFRNSSKNPQRTLREILENPFRTLGEPPQNRTGPSRTSEHLTELQRTPREPWRTLAKLCGTLRTSTNHCEPLRT